MRWRVSLALAVGSTIVLATAIACSSDDSDSKGVSAECKKAPGYEDFAGPFFLNWCTGCHSSALAEGQRQDAPLGVDFDTLDGIRAHSERIVAFAVHSDAMPPAGGPSQAEREALGRWLSCGAPATTQGFDPPTPPPAGTTPPVTGACAVAKNKLPASSLPRCSAQTYQCVLTCEAEKSEDEVDDCREACQQADTTPPDPTTGLSCGGCTFHQAQACGEQAGCGDTVAALSCCIQDCVSKPNPGQCFAAECRDEITAFAYCVYYSDPSCLDHSGPWLGACYAAGAPTADAGAGDAAPGDAGTD
jgi:hypothetical protein